VGADADGGPAVAAAVAAFDQYTGDRARAAVEDAHLEVDQLEILDPVLVAAEVLAQRRVERVDRAVALRNRHQRLAIDVDLDHGLGDGDLLAQSVVAPLD